MPSRGPKVNLKQPTLSGKTGSCCAPAEAHLTGPSARRCLTFKQHRKSCFSNGMGWHSQESHCTVAAETMSSWCGNDLCSLTSEWLSLFPDRLPTNTRQFSQEHDCIQIEIQSVQHRNSNSEGQQFESSHDIIYSLDVVQKTAVFPFCLYVSTSGHAGGNQSWRVAARWVRLLRCFSKSVEVFQTLQVCEKH